MRIFRTVSIVLALTLILSLLALSGQAAPAALLTGPAHASAQAADPRVFLPLIAKPSLMSGSEWSQQAHDAQHTSYSPNNLPTPWRWKWSWNGPDANGAVTAGKFGLPRNSQPVTGGGRVYIAAGTRGVFALNKNTGAQVWNLNPGGAINSTPAYDAETDTLYVVSTDGRLYRLNASNGKAVESYDGQATSTLPLPPMLEGGRVYFSMGTHVYALQKDSLQLDWAYDAGSNVDAPPAFSPSYGLVIAESTDLYVHGIRAADGARVWRVKPTPLASGDPSDNGPYAQVSYGWPVIAEGHGLVLIKLRLNWQTLWTWSPWPTGNAQMRANLASQPGQQALYALRLSDGKVAFQTNVGHGGYEQRISGVVSLEMGPQPVVKRYPDGSEVAYVMMRGAACTAPGSTWCDGRWDSHLGELMLDSSTVPGFQAGDVRFMQNTFLPTDEQPNLSMAGNDIFGGHWMMGIAHQIVDRSASRGASTSAPITVSNLPHIIESASNCGFSASHYCADRLIQDGDPRLIPAGFYIYYNQANTWWQNWSGYAAWVISGDTIYFVSVDGAVIALGTSAADTP